MQEVKNGFNNSIGRRLKMVKIRFALYDNPQNAREALYERHKDIVVLNAGDCGKTTFKMLGSNPDVPESLKKLPGFAFAGISGIPSPPITSFVVLRTTQEVMEALRALEQ